MNASEITGGRCSLRSQSSASSGVAVLWSAVLCFTATAAFGGGPPLQFAKIVGGLSGYAVTSDSQSNIYVGAGPYAGLTKYDAQGNRLWSFGVLPDGSHGQVDIRGIVVDSNTVYVCGETLGTIAGLLTNNSGSSSMFFAKFTPSGSNFFVRIFTNLHTFSKPFARSPDGDFVVAGWAAGNVMYQDLTVSSTGGDDTFVFKIHPDGSLVWYRRGTGAMNDRPDNVVFLPNGDMVLVGTSASVNFGIAGLNISNSSSGWKYMVKMDANGNGLWGKAVSSISIGIPVPSAVAYSSAEDAIVWVGDFSGNLNLVLPPIAGSGSADAFVAKLSSTGGVFWARKMGGALDQFGLAAATDVFGNVYVAGSFQGSITIGSTTLNTFGLRDLYVAKFRDDGTPVWAKQIGWTENDDTVALEFTKAGELLVAGTCQGGVSIDGTYIEGTNSSDAFIAKFSSEAVPPRFVSDPQSQVVSGGMTFNLSATLAVNDPGVHFQWWFDGAPLAGKTNLTLTLTNAQFTNAGSYYLVATNDGGMAQSAAALISYTDATTLTISVHPSLTIFGTVGRTYRIEYATETQGPANWATATNLTLSASPQVWVDQTVAIGERRFYRTVLLP